MPEAGFITEEGTAFDSGEKYRWVIDPLDGTTNFIHGAPPYAVSIGLIEKDEVILGVVYEISKDECFYAWKGSKAMLNGKEIHVSEASTTDEALIVTGFPYGEIKNSDAFIETIKYLIVNSHGIRRLGSAATDLHTSLPVGLRHFGRQDSVRGILQLVLLFCNKPEAV